MSGAYGNTADLDVDLGRLFGSLVRRWKLVLGSTVGAGALAFALATTATPQFRAETRILIEMRESVFTRPSTSPERDSPLLDEEGVTSQVEVIASTDILKQVAKDLKLASRPEFDESMTPSWQSQLMVLAGLKGSPTEVPPEERVLQAFRDKLNVYRVEKSRVIVVQFSSEDPRLAAQVPNTIADTYIAVQRGAKVESNSDATDWLRPEIEDLTQRVKDAEARVAQFRGQSDLLLGQNNSVLATQQLSELSTELSRVRAARSAAEAAATTVRAALAGGGSLDALPGVVQSQLIQRLRERQVQLKAEIADLSTTLLDGHPRLRALRSQLADLDAQIRIEAENVLNSLGTEAETARLREDQLLAELDALKAVSARAGEEEVELRALEREAAAQRELLQSYLARFREASSRGEGDYLPADARVFSRALTPLQPYFPKVIPIAVAAALAGLLLASIGVLLAELFSGRAMRPAPQPLEAPPADLVAAVPARTAGSEALAVLAEAEAMPALQFVPGLAAALEGAAQDVEPELLPPVALPASSELLGIVRAAEQLVMSGASRAIFVSPEGDEGAAAAVLAAREVADTGLRVLLLDLTSTGAASRPMLESAAFPGITNLLTGEAQFAEIIRADRYSDCHVIPVGTADAARAMRAADRLPIVMGSLTTAYDLVVVECGATAPAEINRLMADGAAVMMSVLDAGSGEVRSSRQAFEESGFEPMLVTPVGYTLPEAPRSGRSAA
ncbi:MAG TPA: Wzz/FepE/Etk N-terminal domain-containing protein [Mesorhizobium sp.]|jgi:uncharacterized protein involved in exopolysaccharide biosynthesis/Mrp family chromosome partitioning ATPase|nr:Wzz/FepE/Etk N-terminal domain-containing protein [Mesorhizobium sp.]